MHAEGRTDARAKRERMRCQDMKTETHETKEEREVCKEKKDEQRKPNGGAGNQRNQTSFKQT